MKKNIYIKENPASQIFFILFVCIIAFRLSFLENISIDSFSLKGIFYDNFISIFISCVILISAALWFTISCGSEKYHYRYTGFETGAFLFAVAVILSTYFASNKRAALNDSLTILAIIIAAAALVQIMDSEIKRKILLFFIIAMGVVNVYQCSDQFFNSNKTMIEEYKANPEQQLRQLGIEPGSFQQMLYEHRLYSKDVKGYFSTSNSAGCFFNLAIFSAIALFAPGLKQFRKKNPKTIILPIVIILILFSGLIFTASKGALLSFIVASAALFCLHIFEKFIGKHKILVSLAVITAFTASILIMISYGLKHNTLPGGNSMLVRWEYWTATAKMIADHFFAGVGGNNFSSFYTFYKIPQSLETIRDPHSFPLSIFSAYGIFGLAGFCSCIFVPIIRAMKDSGKSPLAEKTKVLAAMKIYAIPTILILVFLRPLAVRCELGSTIDVAVYIVAIMYLSPVFLFGTILWLCARNGKCCDGFSVRTSPLLCGIFAVLLHNLIDFGMFEPGILMALFAVIALVASQHKNPHTIKFSMTARHISFALTVVLAAVCMWLYIIPVWKTAVKIEKAKVVSYYGYYEDASVILAETINDDIFNPTAAALKGSMETYSYQADPSKNKDKLLLAQKSLETAIARDPADFKNYEKMAQVYQFLAEANPDEHLVWFQKALESLNQAIERYPAAGDLYLTAATVAQQLGKTDYAIEYYIRTIAIEDAYREQFKVMYPGKEIFSRIGDINYKFAKERLEQLRANTENKNK